MGFQDYIKKIIEVICKNNSCILKLTHIHFQKDQL